MRPPEHYIGIRPGPVRSDELYVGTAALGCPVERKLDSSRQPKPKRSMPCYGCGRPKVVIS